MRLLNTTTLELEGFATPEEARYAILSHTWGEGEVTFADLYQSQRETRGWDKIRRSSQIAFDLGYPYIWIDTCCIDKSSSAELSEAINSMYQWYEKAGVCIAFLEDFTATDEPSKPDFAHCRWFSRGWTLQELIAPSKLRFYSKDWKSIGTRTSLKGIIAKVSCIPEEMLEADTDNQRGRLDECSVAEKMSWAANRTTTRPEDLAYCLMGIFDINMPLLYGEGQVKAFKRLQEEIIRSTDDDSVYAWNYSKEKSKKQHFWGLLADEPSAFARRHGDGLAIKRARHLTRRSNSDTTVSNRGLTVELALTPLPEDDSGTIFIALLDCDMHRERSSNTLTPGILLQKTSWHDDAEFVRIRSDCLVLLLLNRIVAAGNDSWDELAPLLEYVRLPEAVPQQVFIPHKLSPPRSPQGMLFHPEVELAFSRLPLDLETGVTVTVLSQPSDWLFYDERRIDRNTARALAADKAERQDSLRLPSTGLRTKSYVLTFDNSSDPINLTKSTILGSLGLEINLSHGMNLWHVYLVTGLEPLPPNPFGTPSLYTVPWYAFVDKDDVTAGRPNEVWIKENRKTKKLLSGRLLRAQFELEARHSRLYYKVGLKAVPLGESSDAQDGV
ncbi:HET domain-containing protein [Trichoderma gracile]